MVPLGRFGAKGLTHAAAFAYNHPTVHKHTHEYARVRTHTHTHTCTHVHSQEAPLGCKLLEGRGFVLLVIVPPMPVT